MDQANYISDIVYKLLDQIKSDGTFDEFRRLCVSNINNKPIYQNWRQRIESYVNKFLSEVKYTPEMNKTIVREQLRKYLLSGKVSQNIDKEADKVLSQILVPRILSVFEPKLAMAVNLYLGINNEASQNELNDFILDFDNIDDIEIASPEFEPLNSILISDTSDDDSSSRISDLYNFGCPISSTFNKVHDSSSGFDLEKNYSKETKKFGFGKISNIDHQNDNNNKIFNTVNISEDSEKFKTDSSNLKSKHSFKSIAYPNSQDKSSDNPFKNSVNQCLTIQEENYIKKGSKKSSLSNVNDIGVKTKVSSNNKIDFVSKHDNIDNMKKTSPEFEPMTSLNDEKNSKSKNKRHSKGSEKSYTRESKDSMNQYSTSQEKSCHYASKDIKAQCSTKQKKSNESKHLSNKLSSGKEKSSSHKSKDFADQCSSDQKKYIMHKSKDSGHRCENSIKKIDGDDMKEIKCCNKSKRCSDSKEKNEKFKRKKKSPHNHRDILPESEEKKTKKKYINLCKKPKSLNGNKSDDESNPGSSSKQKSSILKNERCDKSKVSSKNNNNKTSKKNSENVSKSKGKSSKLKNYDRSNPKCNSINIKELTLEEKNNSITCKNVKKKVTKLKNVKKSMKSDIVAMSTDLNEKVQFHNELKTENISSFENSSTAKSSSVSLDVINGKLEVQENSNQVVESSGMSSFKKKNLSKNCKPKTIKRKKQSAKYNSKNKILKPSESNDNHKEFGVLSVNMTFNNVLFNESDQKSVCSMDVKTKNFDNQKPSTNLILHKESENKIVQKLDSDQLIESFTGFSQTNAIACKHYLKLKRLLNNLNKENNIKQVDDGLKGIECTKASASKDLDTVKSQLIESSENNILNENIQIAKPHNIKITLKKKKNLYPCSRAKKSKSSKLNKDRINRPKENVLPVVSDLKEFDCKDTQVRPCNSEDTVKSQIFELGNSLHFNGFFEQDAQISYGYQCVKRHLQKALKQSSIKKKKKRPLTLKKRRNRKSSNNVRIKPISDMYNACSSQFDSQPNELCNEGVCSVVKNNDHNIAMSENWITTQEKLFKLKPLRVNLVRLEITNKCF